MLTKLRAYNLQKMNCNLQLMKLMVDNNKLLSSCSLNMDAISFSCIYLARRRLAKILQDSLIFAIIQHAATSTFSYATENNPN